MLNIRKDELPFDYSVKERLDYILNQARRDARFINGNVISIDRTNIKDNLTHTNNYLFDSNLTMSAKGLLTMLININDDYNITMEELCNLTKNGSDAVKSTLNELMNKNYLERIKTRDKKGYYLYNYVLYDKQLKQLKQLNKTEKGRY